MRQTITFTIQVDVDADEAAQLAGYPGSGRYGDSYGDVDLPVSGIDEQCSTITTEIAMKVRELLPSQLSPSVWWQDYAIGSPQTNKKEDTQ